MSHIMGPPRQYGTEFARGLVKMRSTTLLSHLLLSFLLGVIITNHFVACVAQPAAAQLLKNEGKRPETVADKLHQDVQKPYSSIVEQHQQISNVINQSYTSSRHKRGK